ncbi:unnamed protein product [Aphanomyces euteiches]
MLSISPERKARFNQLWRVRSQLARECLAEAAGTFILLAFVNGGLAQLTLGEGKTTNYTGAAITTGLAVMLGIHAAGGISGAHINPAVSIAMAFYGRFSWRNVPLYVISQCVGAFLGALIVYIVFYPAILAFDPDYSVAKTASIFATFPMNAEYQMSAFVCELVTTGLLVFQFFALEDSANLPAHSAVKPLTIGLLVIALVLSFGMPTGVALNPARDFGPRVFMAMTGWGLDVFSAADYYFWVPICGPTVGAIVGGGAYMMVVSNHHSPEIDLQEGYLPELNSPAL